MEGLAPVMLEPASVDEMAVVVQWRRPSRRTSFPHDVPILRHG